MLEFFGAAPTILVPDNPRVGVSKADRYEPRLQRSYEEMAAHFSIAVIPTRPYRPKDEAKAELTVLLVCRWVLARLRHQRFFSLEELNAAIRPLLIELNDRPFQKIPGTRRAVFEALDRRAMRALPATPYVYAEWKRVRAAFDYHVEIDHHYYSVPHALVGQELWARFGAATVEVFHRSQRVASHMRSYQLRVTHTSFQLCCGHARHCSPPAEVGSTVCCDPRRGADLPALRDLEADVAVAGPPVCEAWRIGFDRTQPPPSPLPASEAGAA